MGNRTKFRAGARHTGNQPRVQGSAMRVGRETDMWKELQELNLNCLAAQTSVGVVMPYLYNRALRQAIPDQVGLNASINHLTTLMADKIAQRKDLLARWTAYKGTNPTPSPDSWVQLLDFSSEYNDWLTQWASVVLYAVDVMLDFFRHAGTDIPFFCPFSKGFHNEALADWIKDQPVLDAAPATPAPLTGEYIPSNLH